MIDKKICHLTTAHRRDDIRVFQKQCKGLAGKDNLSVVLVVADGLGDAVEFGVQIRDIGASKNRLDRIFLSPKRCYKIAKTIQADVYHFHDPELLPVGARLKKEGHSVIFDSHELTALQIRNKLYLPKFVRNFVSILYEKYEKNVIMKIDAVVVPQEAIMVDYFSKAKRVQVIHNYVSLSEYPEFVPKNLLGKERINIIYSGTISSDRGLGNMLSLIDELGDNFQLVLVGSFSYTHEYEEAKNHPGWRKVKYLGFVDRERLSEIYKECEIGLILFNPVGQYIHATSPLKLFEYMLYGIPIVTPDYGSWPEFNDQFKISFPVSVADTQSQKEAVHRIIDNDVHYKEISIKARSLIEEQYSWEKELNNLINLYKEI